MICGLSTPVLMTAAFKIRKEMVHVQTLPGEPLFAVTGIPFKNGILAGISCSHAVADGISLLLFLYAWMCITDGKIFFHRRPRDCFKARSPISIQQTKRLLPLIRAERSNPEKVDIDNVAEIFTATEYFTDDFLNAIKAEAEKEKITTFPTIRS